jgi:hypothetical protein
MFSLANGYLHFPSGTMASAVLVMVFCDRAGPENRLGNIGSEEKKG